LHIVAALLAGGQRVRVLDNFATDKREDLADVGDRVKLIEGDIRVPTAVAKAVSRVDYVLHQAALPSVTRSIKDPVTTHGVNAATFLGLLAARRIARIGGASETPCARDRA
jgi:nucleoside-diphosphate-sugar epimerase